MRPRDGDRERVCKTTGEGETAAVAELWRSGEELCAAPVWLGEEAEIQKPPLARGFSGFGPKREEGRPAAGYLCGVLPFCREDGERL